MKKYHSVISKEPHGKWQIQFGDYDKDTAKEEMADMKDHVGCTWPKGTKFKVITTGEKQKDIQAAVDKLNVKEKAKEETFKSVQALLTGEGETHHIGQPTGVTKSIENVTIEEARKVIADLAEKEGEQQFAKEVLAGSWDHRNDVQSVLKGTFKPRKLNRKEGA